MALLRIRAAIANFGGAHAPREKSTLIYSSHYKGQTQAIEGEKEIPKQSYERLKDPVGLASFPRVGEPLHVHVRV